MSHSRHCRGVQPRRRPFSTFQRLWHGLGQCVGVTMDGSHLALSGGGGGGTFAVVLSMTVRLHPGGIVGGTILSFNDSVVGNNAYWEAVGAFHALLPAFLDVGNSFTYSIGNTSLTAYGTMPGADLDRVNTLLKQFKDDLAKRGLVLANSEAIQKQRMHKQI